MYEFLATRIHEGKYTWAQAKKLKKSAHTAIVAAFKQKYPGEDIK